MKRPFMGKRERHARQLSRSVQNYVREWRDAGERDATPENNAAFNRALMRLWRYFAKANSARAAVGLPPLTGPADMPRPPVEEK